MKQKKWLYILLVICLALVAVSPVYAAGKQKTYKNTLRKEHGEYYYYNTKGRMVKQGWRTIKGKRYYFQKNGSAAKNLKKIGKETYLFSEKGVLQKKVNTRDLYKLKDRLESTIKKYPGTWSVYVKNLDTNKYIVINNQKMYAASLVKLYAAAAAYEKVEKRKLSESMIQEEMTRMITESDNWCFNQIVHRIGNTAINKWLKKNHYKKTNQGAGIAYTGNEGGLNNGSGYNATSVADCGKFMESVYRGTCVSKSISAKILNLLKHQQRRWKIPAGVPNTAVVANKTGETDDYCHDSAIVYSKGADYVICVMACVPGNAWYDDYGIKELSSVVYNFFNS